MCFKFFFLKLWISSKRSFLNCGTFSLRCRGGGGGGAGGAELFNFDARDCWFSSDGGSGGAGGDLDFDCFPGKNY